MTLRKHNGFLKRNDINLTKQCFNEPPLNHFKKQNTIERFILFSIFEILNFIQPG